MFHKAKVIRGHCVEILYPNRLRINRVIHGNPRSISRSIKLV